MDVAANRLGTAAQKIKDGAVEFGGAVLDKGADFKDAAVEKGRAVLDKTYEYKDAAVEKGRAVINRGTEIAKEYHAQGETYIKTNPYSSVLYALGAGAVVGGLFVYLLNRRERE